MADVKITIIDKKGVKHEVDAPTDISLNLMELCKVYNIEIEATCGGMAMCATCQCYVLSEDVELPQMQEEEEAMLSEVFNSKENSRLSCQIPITEKLDGLIIELASEEY